MFTCTGADRSDGNSDRGVGGGNQWTEGGVGHMCMPADDSGLTCSSEGEGGGGLGAEQG